jgi:hypothetical protein
MAIVHYLMELVIYITLITCLLTLPDTDYMLFVNLHILLCLKTQL